MPKKPAEAGSPRSTPIMLSGRESPKMYCPCSMSRSSAPASKARTNPSPVLDRMFEVKGANIQPHPPEARITRFADQAVNSPEARSIPSAPLTRPPSVKRSVAPSTFTHGSHAEA